MASSSSTASASPSPPRVSFVIGSRDSELAMVQSRHVRDMLKAQHPGLEFRIVSTKAMGDKNLEQALSRLASTNPGLFTKELEVGLLAGAYDIAVHSLKDMPTQLPPGLVLAAITAREQPEDVLLVHSKHKGCGGFAGLPMGAVIGTSSLRRAAMIRRHYPGLVTESVRGNLQTRLAKLEAGDKYDAIVLARAGIERLGWTNKVEAILSPDLFPYGVGQGALGVECRGDDALVRRLLAGVEDPETAARCVAERAFLRHLQGGCQVPIGVVSSAAISSPLVAEKAASGAGAGEGAAAASASVSASSSLSSSTSAILKIKLSGTVLSKDGSECVEGAIELSVGGSEQRESEGQHKVAAKRLGELLADSLKAQGAMSILEKEGGEDRGITYGAA